MASCIGPLGLGSQLTQGDCDEFAMYFSLLSHKFIIVLYARIEETSLSIV